MLNVEGLKKSFGAFVAVGGVSFSVPAGQVIGLLGQNGAGKSTIINMLCGYLRPDAGNITINTISIKNAPLRARYNIGYLPQTPPLYAEQSVQDYLLFCCALKKVNAGDLKRHIQNIAELTGILDVLKRKTGNLSRGYRQRVGLAQALCGSPPLLLLDEPTTGFDPAQSVIFRQTISQLAQKHTIMLSSHTLNDMEAICDRVLILKNGLIVNDVMLKNDVRQEKRVPYILRVEKKDADPEQGLRSLSLLSHVKSVADSDESVRRYRLTLKSGTSSLRQLQTLLSAMGLTVIELYRDKSNLETLFLEAISGDVRGQHACNF